MRVLLLNNRAKVSGGAETMLALTRRLLEAGGHEVTTFAVAETPADPPFWPPGSGGTTGRRAPGALSGVWSRRSYRALSELLSERSFDVAHAHNVYEGLTLSVLDALDRHDVPTVLSIHDYRAICPNGLLRRPDGQLCSLCVDARPLMWPAVRHRCVRGSLRLSLDAAAEASFNRARRRYERVGALVAPSRHTAGMLKSAGLPPERIFVVRNAVAPAPAARVAPARPRFLFVGRLTEDKGIDVLMSAAARLQGRARVAVMGAGRAEPALRSRVSAEGLDVELLGWGSPEDVARELAASTALVMPSLWFEVCPLVILEAFASGVPAVVSDLGGMAELVGHGVEGIRVPPGDAVALSAALAALADEPSLVARLGRAARHRALAEHRPEGHLAGLLEAYAAARADPRRHRGAAAAVA